MTNIDTQRLPIGVFDSGAYSISGVMMPALA